MILSGLQRPPLSLQRVEVLLCYSVAVCNARRLTPTRPAAPVIALIHFRGGALRNNPAPPRHIAYFW